VHQLDCNDRIRCNILGAALSIGHGQGSAFGYPVLDIGFDLRGIDVVESASKSDAPTFRKPQKDTRSHA